MARRVPLSAFAKIERVEGVVAVHREHGQRYAVVRSNVRDRDLVGFVAEAKQAVEDKSEAARRAIASNGAASLKTSNGRRRGWPW